MHGSVRDGLENWLAAKQSAAALEITAHISGCAECSSEIEAMRYQAQMVKTLQPTADVEPSAGFYARVMQRIEASARRSIWWVFVYSPIGKRLAYTSIAVVLALGSYMVAAENSDGHLGGPTAVVAQDSHYDAPVTGDADEQRQAVLANFASHPSIPPSPLSE